MTAHICAHPGVCSAPQTGGGAGTTEKWGGTEKNFFRRFAPAFVPPPHFQFASGASVRIILQLWLYSFIHSFIHSYSFNKKSDMSQTIQ